MGRTRTIHSMKAHACNFVFNTFFNGKQSRFCSGVVVLFLSLLLLLFCFAFCCLFRRGLKSGWQDTDPCGIKY